jgi:hypothetical protein
VPTEIQPLLPARSTALRRWMHHTAERAIGWLGEWEAKHTRSFRSPSKLGKEATLTRKLRGRAGRLAARTSKWLVCIIGIYSVCYWAALIRK